MMRTERGLRFAVARVTIELTAPLSIGTGRGDDLSDSVCVVDANGMPALPGTSIAGVLRAAVARRHEAAYERDLFGFVDNSTEEGASSRVEVSWGAVHDANDRPVAARPSVAVRDEVLAFVAGGVHRDHVRISHRGVADDRGKFDVRAVPAGARFTFELLVHAGDVAQAERDLRVLLASVDSGEVALGGRTRRGAGTFEVRRTVGGSFDLTTERDRARWLSVRTDRSAMQSMRVDGGGEDGTVALALTLRAEDHWIFGTGQPVRDEHIARSRGAERAHDRVPVSERRIRWERAPSGGERGHVVAPAVAPLVVPATSIKGALRHRALFHARRIAREWAEVQAKVAVPEGHDPLQRGIDPADRAGATQGDDAVDSLFGTVRGVGGGWRGRVAIEDVYIDTARFNPLQHVSLDRFTQAPMDGLLFSEAPVAGGEISLRLRVERDVDATALCALYDALDDLVHGRLALGAGANRGHGVFRGDRAALNPLLDLLPADERARREIA